MIRLCPFIFQDFVLFKPLRFILQIRLCPIQTPCFYPLGLCPFQIPLFFPLDYTLSFSNYLAFILQDFILFKPLCFFLKIILCPFLPPLLYPLDKTLSFSNPFQTFNRSIRVLYFPRNPRDLLKSWNLGTDLSVIESRL